MPNQNAIDGEILYPSDGADYYEVRRRRMASFVVDYIIVALLCVPAAFLIGFAGIITLGLGWLLYAIMVPLVAIAYLALTMGSERQATIGMVMFSLRVRRLDGRLIDAPLAILHGILFWLIHSVFSPLMLIASLFSSRKRLLHDWLLGTEVINR